MVFLPRPALPPVIKATLPDRSGISWDGSNVFPSQRPNMVQKNIYFVLREKYVRVVVDLQRDAEQ